MENFFTVSEQAAKIQFQRGSSPEGSETSSCASNSASRSILEGSSSAMLSCSSSAMSSAVRAKA